MPPSSANSTCRSRSTCSSSWPAWSASAAGPSGTADAGYIFHETSTTPFHATHIAVHELAHMLLGHDDTEAWYELIALLASDVDQALMPVIPDVRTLWLPVCTGFSWALADRR